ncbi:MAG: GIY-YIG nuclease family protein [Bacteroidales bacterium]|nr:GIY-YIG nuclease family protein [Bacteroidales bacterium]
MATRGKSINLFLMDSTPNGRIKCTLANWTGIAYKIPRTDLDKCQDIPILKQSGVYFLFGISDETGQEVVYVGQAGVRKNGEGILLRLKEHVQNPEKDYWTEAITFATSNNSFGPTEISYLENRFCNMAKIAGRNLVKNDKDPNSGHVTEEKESELEEFIDYARIVMGTLGHKVFEPLTQSSCVKADGDSYTTMQEVTFELKQGNCDARGQRTSDGFAILAGSKIKTEVTPSCPKHAKKAREVFTTKFSSDGILKSDISLRSPAEAACFVTGTSINAREAWKTSDGRTLNEVENSEMSDL